MIAVCMYFRNHHSVEMGIKDQQNYEVRSKLPSGTKNKGPGTRDRNKLRVSAEASKPVPFFAAKGLKYE